MMTQTHWKRYGIRNCAHCAGVGRAGIRHSRLSVRERLALLLDRERLSWENGRYRGLLRDARLKVAQACVEDVNYKTNRGLDKSLMAALVDGACIQRAQNVLITGPTGSGKTWIVRALAHQACR